MAVDFSSPYYPYEKVDTGALTLRGAEFIPYKLLTYLLDLPDAAGYIPPTSNEYPRARLAKYLWYDGPDPLAEPLPTPVQKRSMLFDPYNPVLNTDADKAAHPKGYRLFWQRINGQAQLDAMTTMRCYVTRSFERRKYVETIGVRFEVMCNVNFETNTKTNAYQRSYDIEQCLREALNGVNMAGIGTISLAQAEHSDNGSGYLWNDMTGVGRYLHLSITWAEGGGGVVPSY